ncbi:putative metallopeptidase, M16 family protein [Christiangramia flava JLT2011]|uniref:Insulinase-like:Peptidase M16, C-terminal n=2 Tax=Christiangramia TaxID=292691 RepID=A0A1L7I4C0_9FLAO|nr:Insulinase-like:Peptidase M16, C-terminal precursor [Christiangramia flava JLT2011]OSS40745.1 putative metallopeptidase, M16 family protein [Christiangramia flava JLT2011]
MMMKKNIFAIALLLLASVGVNAQIDRSQMPEPGPAPKVNVEEPETFDLDNGLKVMVVENHKLPRVAMSLRFDNPPHVEGQKAGVSGITGDLLGTGTQNMSKDDFNEKVDFLGARLNFYSNGASANTLSKYFPEVLKLMADGILHPKFTQEEFDKSIARTEDFLKSSEKDVSYNARRVRSALAYGKNHPYGEFQTQETVKNLSLADVENYYKTWFSPANAYLVIVGDVDEDEVKDLVKGQFSSWKKSPVPAANVPAVSNVNQTEIDFIDMPNAVQSEIALVNTINLKKKDDDYFPILVANKILGGGGEARLFLNLREDKGYTYGAYSSTGNDKYAATFVASASVRNEVTDSSVVAFLDEIYKIRNEQVTASELARAKAKLTGDFVLSLEQPSTIANFAMEIETEDLDDDFYEEYLEKIDEVTAEDVQRVAKKYFLADNSRIVIAGKASDVLENLEKMTYNGKTIPVKFYNRFAEEVEKPVAKKMDPSVSAETVFNKYIDAIGGREAVENVESVVMLASATIQGMALDLEMKRTKDGKLSQTISMNGNAMNQQVFNGESGYLMAQGQKMPYNEEQIEAAKGEANPFPELNVGDASVTGIEQVEGKDAYAVKLSDNTVNYYDTESGLKVKMVKTMSQGGQTMTIPTVYADYQEVKGVKFPFSLQQSMGPQSFEFKVSEIKVNEDVSEEDFKVE